MEKYIRNLIDNQEPDLTYFERIGYEVAGPIFLGYTLWIIQSSLKYKISDIFFLARDGNQILEVYKKIKGYLPCELPLGKYMYASRRAMLIPSLEIPQVNSDELRFLISSWWENLRVKEFLSRLKIDIPEEEAQRVSMKAGFSSLDYKVKRKDYKKLEKMFLLISSLINEKAVRERQALKRYLEKENLFKSANPCIVDIGWGGSMQKSIYSILRQNDKYKLNGLYFGTNNRIESVRNLGMVADSFFLRELKVDSLVLYAIWQSTEILEFMFSAQHPSVIFFEERDSDVYPVFSAFNNDAYYRRSANILQAKAQKFVDDFLESVTPSILMDYIENSHINSVIYTRNLLKMTLKPTICDAMEFGKIRHIPGLGETNQGKYIVRKSRSLLPWKLKNLFENAYWENGFLVDLNRIQLIILYIFCSKYRDRKKLRNKLFEVLKAYSF